MLNLEAFEILAHNVDYMNDVAKALVDSLLIATVVRRPSSHTGRRKKVRSKNRGGKQEHKKRAHTPFCPIVTRRRVFSYTRHTNVFRIRRFRFVGCCTKSLGRRSRSPRRSSFSV